MLNVSHMSVREDKQEKMFDLSFVMRVFRRHWKLITWITVGGLLAGIVFVVLYPPTYRSVARLLISPPLVNVFQRNSLRFVPRPLEMGRRGAVFSWPRHLCDDL